MLNVSFGGLTSAFTLYIIVSIFGFATYGDKIDINYLKTIDVD